MAEGFVAQHDNSSVLRDVAVYKPEDPAKGPGEDVHEDHGKKKLLS